MTSNLGIFHSLSASPSCSLLQGISRSINLPVAKGKRLILSPGAKK